MCVACVGCTWCTWCVRFGALDVGEDGVGGDAALVVSVSGHEDVPGAYRGAYRI